ncbi:hypothetical protein FRC08_011741 [Ceratobasidium sp. 394]|nr:hypothetical protein FRC08_011741 [Ceratobasidium sp. 394]KAG9086445.1 hypothetical protein FS749_003635 [Ceratobasidium sp. UAMH 11750]
MNGNGKAALNIPNTNETYFFNKSEYCQVQWMPDDSSKDILIHGPASIYKEWDALHNADFKQVDAALEIGNNLAYIFSGKKCCLVRGKHELIGRVSNITDVWTSLKEAKFDTVDAALHTPGHPNQAYFFSSNKFVRVEFESMTMDNKIVDGPKSIHEGWPNMPFKQIDMALPRPHNDQKGVYFFSGSKYCQLQVDVGGPDDKIISREGDVAKNWPALKEAGFY